MSLETAIDDDEKWFSQYDDVEWIDDVAQHQCTRCHKVLVQHYISNCQHKFCSNCKRILDDGSHRWRCPDCKEFIKDLGRQDLEFKDRVGRLRLHCPHRKYGCKHNGPFKDLREHLQECKHTKESALPVLYEGQITNEMLERMFTMQMLELRKEMKREMKELEERCLNKDVDAEQQSVNESAWELSVEVDQMKREIAHIIKKQKDGKWKLRVKLSQVNDRIDGVKSDLHVETTRLRNEIKDLPKQAIESNSSILDGISLAVEENKAKIMKLETKTETWMEIMDFKDRKNNDLKHELKNEFKDELKTHKINVENKIELFEQTMNEMKMTQERKWTENNERVGGVNDFEISLVEVIKKAETMLKEVNNIKTEIEKQKENVIEINRKIQLINEENIKMIRQVEFLQNDMLKSTIKLNSDQITYLPMKNDSSTENKILEQKVLHLESLFLLKTPQMNMFNLAEGQSHFRPDFNYRVMMLKHHLQRLPYEETSKWFEWAEYPLQARIKVRITSRNCVDLSLSLKPFQSKSSADMKILPQVYYVVKYQPAGWHPKRIYRVASYEFPTKFNYSLAYELRINLDSEFTNASHYINDGLDVDVYVEPPNIARTVYSYDGTLNWAIDNYLKRKLLTTKDLARLKEMTRNDLVEYHESPYFYTGSKGYRMQVRMWLANGLKAEIRFLTGKFDDDLSATFPHQTTVTLFNRKNSQHNITKTVRQDIQQNKYYIMDVCNDKEVENMVENDHIFYKVNIEPSQK